MSPMEILKNFDLTHCQVAYDGFNILYTNEFIEAITTKITKINVNKIILSYRLIKAYNRGYSIDYPDCYIKCISLNDDINTTEIYNINDLDIIIKNLLKDQNIIKKLTKNYIPNLQNYDKEQALLEMKKICEIYAYENKYIPLNDFNMNVFIDNIQQYLVL